MEHRRRRWWTFALTVATVLMVFAATLSVTFRLAVNAVPGYRSQVQAYVAKAVGHPARIGAMNLTWRHLRPSLDFQDVALLDAAGAPLAHLDRLRLGFTLRRLIARDWLPSTAEIYGLRLEADIDTAGRWVFRGFSSGTAQTDDSDWLPQMARFGQIVLEDGRLLVHDPRLGRLPLEFRVPGASLNRSGDRYVAQIKLLPPAAIGGAASVNAHWQGKPEHWSGRWTFFMHDLHGWPWLAHELGRGAALRLSDAELTLDGDIEGERVNQARLHVQASAVSGSRGGRPAVTTGPFDLEVSAHREASGWQAALDRLVLGAGTAASPIHGQLQLRSGAQGDVIDLGLGGLQLAEVAPWAALALDDEKAAARLRLLRGEVPTLNFHLEPGADPASAYSLSAQLAEVTLPASPQEEGFSGLGGSLLARPGQGELHLQQNRLEVQLPRTFAQPLSFDSLSADLRWQQKAGGWQIEADGLEWSALGAIGKGHAGVLVAAEAGTSTRLDIEADFSAADVVRLKPYMPVDWGPSTREWLTRAVQRGRVTQGHLRLKGAMADFPFVEKPDGEWSLHLGIADGVLAYAKGWPAAQRVQAALDFAGHGLTLEGSAELGGAEIDHLDARIPDLRDALLSVDGRTHGDAQRYFAVLRESPIAARLSGLLTQTQPAGPAAVELHLQIPLKDAAPEVGVSGSAKFEHASFTVRGLGRPIEALSGTVAFDDRSVRSESLSGTFYGTPVHAVIRPAADSPVGLVQFQFDADAGADNGLAAAFTPDWLRRHLQGNAEWHGALPLSGAHSGQLQLFTNLIGVASSLPVPLAKTAADPLPLTVLVGGGAEGAAEPGLRVEVDSDDRMRLALRFSRASNAGESAALPLRGAEARFGPGAAPRAAADGLYVTGTPALLDIESWLSLVDEIGEQGAAGGSGAALPFRSADLSPESTLYQGFLFHNTRLQVAPAANGVSVQLDGADVQGRIEWSRGNGGAVLARLQQARLEPRHNTEDTGKQESIPLDPTRTPVIDFNCESLRLGEADLGRISLRTSRVADGQALDTLQVEGSNLKAKADGRWLRTAEGSSAELNLELDSSNVGAVLQGLGFARNLEAKRAELSAHLHWSPAPAGVDLAQAQGGVHLKVAKGSLKAVEPGGAGRVLGLLNLYALPRRLAFDFRDVVSKGLGFDTLEGGFTLDDGQARTDKLQIESPSMKMVMHGRIGLAAHDYDEQVTVYPDVSTSVTVGATLLGGPIAGGVALLAQEIFKKPFNQLSRFSYHVTGSWDNPQVNGLGKDERPREPGAPGAPPPQEPLELLEQQG